MKKSWGLTQKILTGEKKIETRWYKNKSKPWGIINPGDTIYFKDSGELVSVKAVVSKVEQYERLDNDKVDSLMKKYSELDLGTSEIPDEISKYVKDKRYAIIIHLIQPEKVVPFEIDKSGYGAMSAWLCVDNINIVIK